LRIHTINDRPGGDAAYRLHDGNLLRPMLPTCSIGADDNLSQMLHLLCRMFAQPTLERSGAMRHGID
jgi:hypothetical protein